MKWSTLPTLKHAVLAVLFLGLFALVLAVSSPGASGVAAQSPSGPEILNLQPATAAPAVAYQKFEVKFDINNTTLPYPQHDVPGPGELNPYFPYDPTPPDGINPGIGITVVAQFKQQDQTWEKADTFPCFYHQPVLEEGSGTDIALLPTGSPDWRCRYTPEQTGSYQYRIQAIDAGGTGSWSQEQNLSVVACDGSTYSCKGFVEISESDPRFFEFSNGEPFSSPLVSMEEGGPFNRLYGIQQNIPLLGTNGIRFIRWFPTGEGANYFVNPYADWMKPNWAFGAGKNIIDAVDESAEKIVSFSPYYYSNQNLPVKPGSYRASFSAYVEGEQVFRFQAGNQSLDICSSTGTYHESQGFTCDFKQDGWHEYTMPLTIVSTTNLYINLRGLYVSSDAPTPFDQIQSGKIGLHSIRFQRDETGSGGWGPNLLTRGDPQTIDYVDQRSAARLDKIFELSETNGVYHKLTMFHKNGQVLNRMNPDGTLSDYGTSSYNFYSQDGYPSRWYQRAYASYFLARWGYSTALHSLEIGNETNPWDAASWEAGVSLAQFIHQNAPRYILMADSFWHSFPVNWNGYGWDHPEMDYADKHWYTSPNQTTDDIISNVWQDSAAYTRECFVRFQTYQDWLTNTPKPIVRGEGGIGQVNTAPHHPDIAIEQTGAWYHKKLWANLGMLGNTCDGEWYPRIFTQGGQYPNNSYDTLKTYKAFDNFLAGEFHNNGNYVEIGTDLTGNQQISISNQSGSSLRAWGVMDPLNGRVLLWIDNSLDTWYNRLHNSSAIGSASATLTLTGLDPATYTLEWWDTATGTVTNREAIAADIDGNLNLVINQLSTDAALKILGDQAPSTTPTPTPSDAQTLSLNAGWNMISSNVQPEPSAISAVFAEVADDLVQAKNDDGEVYWPALSVDTIVNWDIRDGYQVYMRNPATLTIRGTEVNPAENPIALQGSWALIGYLGSASQPVDQAMATIENELVLLKNVHGDVYWPALGINELGDIEPGQGYKVYLASPATLTYSASVGR